jgi:DNA-directed RNA polymerase subunit E'/Rpb7
VLTFGKNIPSDIKWEPNTVPPQYTDHADQVIEKGTSLRLKILGVKPDVAAINAIGTIKEDYLGYVASYLFFILFLNFFYFRDTLLMRICTVVDHCKMF